MGKENNRVTNLIYHWLYLSGIVLYVNGVNDENTLQIYVGLFVFGMTIGRLFHRD